MKKLVFALALTLAAATADAGCPNIQLGKTYRGVGIGSLNGIEGYWECDWRFKRVRNNRLVLDGRRSFCEGAVEFGWVPTIAASSTAKVRYKGSLALKGCRIVQRSDALIHGEVWSRSKGRIKSKRVLIDLTEPGFYLDLRR
jgi:hypothetical protein